MLRTFIATVALLSALPLQGGQFLAGIAIVAASASVAPAPQPPTPSGDACDNCNGSGKVGDGTVFVTCPVCDGTGKKTTANPPRPCESQAAAMGKCPCGCADCTCGTGEPCGCSCPNCTCPKALNPAVVAAAKVPPNFAHENVKWDATNRVYLSADGKFQCPPGKDDWQPVAIARRRIVTIPAEYKTVMEFSCPKTGGCGWRPVRRMVRPARTIVIEGTSDVPAVKPLLRTKTALAVPPYPSRPLGSYWTMNGGPISRQHLASPFDHHAHERFDPLWLNSLSHQQIQALGSDSHNGHDKFREHFIVRAR